MKWFRFSPEKRFSYNVHFNDAYREWDDDLIAGSTNLYETLEFLYYIEKSGYQGYLGFDIFPYRIHPVRALELCTRNTLDLYRLLQEVDKDALLRGQKKMDAADTHEVVRKVSLSETLVRPSNIFIQSVTSVNIAVILRLRIRSREDLIF